MRDFPRTMVVLAASLATILLSVARPVDALPYPVRKEVRLEVVARPILIENEQKSSNLKEIRLELPPSGVVSEDVSVPLGSATMPPRVRIEAEGRPSESDRPHRITLRSQWVGADGVAVRAKRVLDVREGSTGFFEAAYGPGWRLTLAIRAERVERVVARAPTAPDRPIVFRVEVGRVVTGDYVALETNDLSTFDGEPVEYAFRLGRDETLEQLRLVITPLRIEGDIAKIQVDVSGTIHAGRDSPLLLSRNETVLTGRETTSEVTAAVGEPPEGFRFRITPTW